VLVNEKRFGKEQIKVKIDRLAGDVPLAFFGDPIASSTGYAVCLYDEHNALRAALHVDRPGATCGTKPCWKAVGGPGYKYTDRSLVSDGVLHRQSLGDGADDVEQRRLPHGQRERRQGRGRHRLQGHEPLVSNAPAGSSRSRRRRHTTVAPGTVA
jgi:hypothetical protein